MENRRHHRARKLVFLLLLMLSAYNNGLMAEDYCLEAQRWIGHSSAPAELVVHTDFDSFVESKAVLEPMQVQQYLSRPLNGDGRIAVCEHLLADHHGDDYEAQVRGAAQFH